MIVPQSVTPGWMATLADAQVTTAESRLHSEFVQHETRERARRGQRYAFFNAPAALVDAWLRWQLLMNEAQARGLLVRRRA